MVVKKKKKEINKKEVEHVGTMSPAFNALRKEESMYGKLLGTL